jgi:hypothetical protein
MAFALRNEFHDDFARYFSQRTEVRQANYFAEANLAGDYYIHYSLGTGKSGEVSEPEYLRKVEEFADWCRRQPEVIHVYSITEILKRLKKNLHGDHEAYYRSPETQELAAQYLLLYEMSVPFGLDLNDRINVNKSATRLTVTLKYLPTKHVLAFEQRTQRWLSENTLETMFARGTGPLMIFSRIGKRNTESMVAGDLLALKRVKRIASADKSGALMGSEFVYEDVSSQEVEKYTYQYLRDEIYDGQHCFVIERYPVDRYSGYKGQVVWLDKAEYRYVSSTEYYLKTSPTKLAKAYQDAGSFEPNRRMIELLIDQEAVRAGLAASDQ